MFYFDMKLLCFKFQVCKDRFNTGVLKMIYKDINISARGGELFSRYRY